MDTSEGLSNKILEERQVEKFSQFVENYEVSVAATKRRLRGNDNNETTLRTSTTPIENVSIFALTDSDNGNISKVILALVSITEEMENLTRDGSSSLLHPIIAFNELDVGVKDDLKVGVGRLCHHFQHLFNFTDHCKDVLHNLLSQLNAIISSKNVSPVKITPSKLTYIWTIVGRFLSMLMILDSAMTHSQMQTHWMDYKRMIKALRNEPEKFQSNVENVRNLEKILLKLEAVVVNGKMFETVTNAKIDVGKILTEELSNFVRNFSVDVEKEASNDKYLMLVGLSALARKLSGQLDKKLISKLWDIIKKLPALSCVSLSGVVWTPEKFFQKYLSQSAESQTNQERKYEAGAETSRRAWFSSRLGTLSSEVKALTSNISSWIIKIRTRMGQNTSNIQLSELGEITMMTLSGIELAKAARTILNSCINFYCKLEQPLTKSAIGSLGDLMASLKMIQATFKGVMPKVIDICMKSSQHGQFLILNILQQIKKTLLVSDKKYSDEKVDVLSCVLVAERVLAGPVTPQRIRVANVAVSLCSGGTRFIKEDDMKQMMTQLSVMETLINIQKEITDSCSTKFLSPLYSPHKDIITVVLQDLYANRKSESLFHVIVAVQNCANILAEVKHLPQDSGFKLMDELKDNIEQMVQSEIVAPLCKDIETELRLVVHKQAGVKLDERNPFKTTPVDLQPFLRTGPLVVLGSRLSVKHKVEAYLEATFYNLTTVSLHNWRTYAEMREAARTRLDLETVEDNLPSQTVEQGLDVLEMMRNIQVFTAGYNYNMNSQVFVEQTSNNKHLNTISIRHIANSIRTHGSGIINTTVNFTYQFLRKKFVVFSQFLYDEHIKSRLTKDAKYFKENKNSLDQKYPLDRAVKFNRGIRKLGLMPDGVSTYLDQFRLLITHIGNAMGFVRMVRSGGIQQTSQSIRFVPDLEYIPTFGTLASKENLPDEVINVAETLDATLANLTSSFESSNEYFNILVQVFSNQLNDEKQTHLHNFYLILPALTVNYIEHISTSKEKIFKKNLDGAAFTDDGFSIGLAYCLTLLDQWKQADSLHWFDSVTNSFNSEQKNVDIQRSSEKDEKLQNTLTLKLKRIETTLKEFQLLQFNVNSARIFFHADTVAGDGDDDSKSTSGSHTNVD